MSDDTVTATAHLIIKGKRRDWAPVNGKFIITGARIVGARTNKPTKLGEDEIVVKVQVQLPKQAFEPLEPEALIVVPEELIQHVVEVEATE